MKAKQWTWQASWILAALACLISVAPVVASDMGMAAANQVDLNLYNDLLANWLYTRTGHNRGPSGPQHNLARDNILALFRSYGLSADLEPFTYSGRQGVNVVAVQPGTLYPNQVYIIGGHYDSVSNPGADDNASGVAAVLECARILSQYQSNYTIKYIAFDLEELGLYGSYAYVQMHPGENIRGMISADMVCYDPNTNNARIYGRTASNPIKNALAAAVAEYGQGLTTTILGQLDASDHAPFEQAGYQACLLIEGEVWNNPNYHTQQDCYDTPNYLNMPFAVKMTRSLCGWLVDAAGVQVIVNALKFEYPNGLPQYCSPAGGTRVRVEVIGVGSAVPQPGTGRLHYNTGGGWQDVAMTEVSPNVYDAFLPAAACGSEVLYYFSAQAVGGQVFTDPRQAPSASYAATAAYGVATVYENNFDTSPGWTISGGLWAFGRPTGGGGAYGGPDPTSGKTGLNVYGYNLNGDYTNNMPQYHLTSTPIDCTGAFRTRLHFWRWLGVERSRYDHAYVRVSNNGSTWTTVWENPDAETADREWKKMDLDISAVADGQPTVYLRWTMGTTDGGWTYCGWNIDDVSLTALDCTAPWLLGDMNCDGAVNFGDINPFVLALTNPAGYAAAFPDCNIMNGDINQDGYVDFGDINPFVSLLTNP